MRIALTKTENSIKHQHYIDWLKGNDTIEVVTIDARHHNPDLIASCDGLVLSGGVDITPALYGSLKHDYDNAPDTFNKLRDEFEIEAYENALKNNIPILGICRGFQLINCINGGTLHQDLGESLNTIHWGEKKPADKIHLVTVEKETLLEEITGFNKGHVNSAHHQAIEKLGEELLANCFSEDGTIEGIEWKDKTDKPFMLAVQWHPERMHVSGLVDSYFSEGLRNYFIKAVQIAGKTIQ